MTSVKSDSDKTLVAMKNFAEQYAKRTDTYFCMDPSVTAIVIEGLARHKDELGSPLCPCRHYDDKEAEVKNTFLELSLCSYEGKKRMSLYVIYHS